MMRDSALERQSWYAPNLHKAVCTQIESCISWCQICFVRLGSSSSFQGCDLKRHSLVADLHSKEPCSVLWEVLLKMLRHHHLEIQPGLWAMVLFVGALKIIYLCWSCLLWAYWTPGRWCWLNKERKTSSFLHHFKEGFSFSSEVVEVGAWIGHQHFPRGDVLAVL